MKTILKAALVALAAALFVTMHSGSAWSVEYNCPVTHKSDSEHEYGQEILDRYDYSVRIVDLGEIAAVSRCSYAPSETRITCDRYEIDKIVFDDRVRIKKYYHFQSQFDVQLFANLSFVENNGRGGIAYGTCQIVST